MPIDQWLKDTIPDLSDKVAIVTGATSGLGFHTAHMLASRDATVIMACRNAKKAEQARNDIEQKVNNAKVSTMSLDLADLDSVGQFAEAFSAQYHQLHILVNNAGVMATPLLRTRDNFEMQLGTNHLGHFALTGQLLPLIKASPNARVINVSSIAHKFGRLNFEDINSHNRYQKWMAYAQSKLAVHVFSNSLARRFEQQGIGAKSITAHPGFSATNLQSYGAQLQGAKTMVAIIEWVNRVFAQSAEMGTLPTLLAATVEEVVNGDYCGPDGFLETRGFPKCHAKASKASRDKALAE